MRFAARIRRAVRAFYEGAQRRIGTAWIRATYQDAHLDLGKATRQVLQEKSRHFARNSALLNRLADLFETYVVGSGLVVHPSSSNEAFNEKARAEFKGWSRFPDVASRQPFDVLQSLIARAWFVDGEAFIYLTVGNSGRPRVQLIEAHRVETPPDKSDREGISIIDGVEIDPSNGRPVAYHVWQPGATRGTKTWTKISSDFLIHCFEPSRPGQYRGEPFVTCVLNDLSDYDELQKLEMKAARANAAVANVLTRQGGEADTADILRSGGTITTNSDGSVDAVKETLGGDTVVLNVGESLTQISSDRPSVAQQWYWDQLTEKICAGVGIPAILAYPGSMQGTVYRGALDMAATWFRSRFLVMRDVVQRIYEYVIEKRIQDLPSDWQSTTVHAPRAVNVDVGYNSQAAISEVAAGTRTLASIYGPRGEYWREELKQLSDEMAFAASLGLQLGAKANTQQGANQ